MQPLNKATTRSRNRPINHSINAWASNSIIQSSKNTDQWTWIDSTEKEEKVKVADALGVDWSQLITPKEVKEHKEAGSFRKQWSPGAIFSRIGLPKTLLKPGLYEDIIKKLNDKGDEVDILHPIAFVHAFKRGQMDQETKEGKSILMVRCTVHTQ